MKTVAEVAIWRAPVCITPAFSAGSSCSLILGGEAFCEGKFEPESSMHPQQCWLGDVEEGDFHSLLIRSPDTFPLCFCIFLFSEHDPLLFQAHHSQWEAAFPVPLYCCPSSLLSSASFFRVLFCDPWQIKTHPCYYEADTNESN